MREDLASTFAQIAAARGRQMQTRTGRTDQLTRLVEYVRMRFAESLTTVDPITGSRLMDIGVEENKGQGGMSLVLALFDGARFRLAVDSLGRFTHAALPDVFKEVGKVLEVRVAPDLSRAELCYLAPSEGGGRFHVEPIEKFLGALLQASLATIEAQVEAAPGAPATAAARAPAAAPQPRPVIRHTPEPPPPITPPPLVEPEPAPAAKTRPSLKIDIR